MGVMSLASLKEYVEAELAVLILGGGTIGGELGWQLAVRFGPEIGKHLPAGTPLRFPVALIPDWYRHLWGDQLDGRIVVEGCDHTRFEVVGPDPRVPDGTKFSVNTGTFLEAVLAGQVLEATL